MSQIPAQIPVPSPAPTTAQVVFRLLMEMAMEDIDRADPRGAIFWLTLAKEIQERHLHPSPAPARPPIHSPQE